MKATRIAVLGGAALASALALASCGMRQEIIVAKDGSGSILFSFSLNDLVGKTITSLAESSGSAAKAKKGLFDLEEIKKEIAQNPGLSLKSLSSPSAYALKGEIAFKNLEKSLFSDKEVADSGILKISRKDKKITMDIRLAKHSLKALPKLLPMGSDGGDLFEALAPPALDESATPMTEEEYIDMLKSLFGEAVGPEVKKAAAEIKFSPKTKIVAQKGGILSGNSVIFKIPILSVLMMEKPIELSVTWEE
jgi:hypothetical protein